MRYSQDAMGKGRPGTCAKALRGRIARAFLAAVLALGLVPSVPVSAFADDPQPAGGLTGATVSLLAQEVNEGDYTYSIGFSGSNQIKPEAAYDMFTGVTWEPGATDPSGEELPFRLVVTKLVHTPNGGGTATETDYSANPQETLTVTPTTSDDGSAYTATFEIQRKNDDGTWTSLQNRQTYEKTVRVLNSVTVADTLNEDGAYIKSFTVEVASDGTPGFDANDDPGNDSSANNSVVRTFDSVKYDMNFDVECYDQHTAYKQGYVFLEMTLPVTSDKAAFDTAAMNWMKADSGSEISAGGYDWELVESGGKQVLTCAREVRAADGNDSAIPFVGDLYATVNVYGMGNGDTLKPTFRVWMDKNGQNPNHLEACETHASVTDVQGHEMKTADGPEVRVSAKPSWNVQLKKVSETYANKKGTFDFDATSDETAPNYGKGKVEGRMIMYGITLQLYNQEKDKGLKGIEFPQGELSFDIDLSMDYRPDNGSVIANAGTPLVWSLGANYQNTMPYGRTEESARGSAIEGAPTNGTGTGAFETSPQTGTNTCWNGGTWSCTVDNSGTVHVKVSDYAINPLWFPNCDTGRTPSRVHQYFNPAEGVKNIGCFSAGKMYVLVPFGSLVGDYGSGTITMKAQDSKLAGTSVSGTKLTSVQDNSNQAYQGDDSDTSTVYVSRPGGFNNRVLYTLGNGKGDWGKDVNGTLDCFDNGKDVLPIGHDVGLHWGVNANSQGDDDNVPSAVDCLVKFDDRALTLANQGRPYFTSYTNAHFRQTDLKWLYAARRDGNGWGGNDAAMDAALIEDLVYYDSLDALQAEGKTCVGVLYQMRDPEGKLDTADIAYFHACVDFTVKPDASLAGSAYQAVVVSNAWKRGSVAASAVPSILDVQSGTATHEQYKTGIWQNNFRSHYDKAQYENGVYVGGHSGNNNIGDSLYLVAYKSSVGITVEQTDAQGSAKKTYDLGHNQFDVDYRINPHMQVEQGVNWTQPTTLTVTSTLPEGLSYIPGTAHFGGTYTPSAEAGYAGTVADGELVEPDVAVNADGTTTLTWVIENATVRDDVRPIRFRAKIASDTPANTQFEVTATVNTAEDTRPNTTANGNLASCGIETARTGSYSVTKVPDSQFIDLGGEMKWTIAWSNNGSTNNDQRVFLDTMPENNGPHGSHFNGTYTIKEVTVTPEEGKAVNDYELYYTTDDKGYDLTATDINTRVTEIKNGSAAGCTWAKADVGTDGKVSLAHTHGTHVSAWCLIGPLSAGKKVQAQITVAANEGTKGGDAFVNGASMGSIRFNSGIYVVSRELQGVAWVDANRDGVRQNTEARLPGVKVSLVDSSGNAVNDVFNNEIEPKITDADGAYRFENLAEGTYMVKFESGSGAGAADLGAYYLTTANAANAAASVTSKAVRDPGTPQIRLRAARLQAAGDNGLHDPAEGARITGISMPAAADILTSPHVVRYQDIGLYQTSSLSVGKSVTGNAATGADRTRPFDFTASFKDADGEPFAAAYTKTLANGTEEHGVLPDDGRFTLANGERVVFTNLYPGTAYTIAEDSVDGFVTSHAVGGAAAAYGSSVSGTAPEAGKSASVAFTNERSTVDFSLTKKWVDQSDAGDTRPDPDDVASLFKLYAKGQGASGADAEVTTPAPQATAHSGARANEWTVQWAGLPAKAADGSSIEYYAAETAPAGYTPAYSGTDGKAASGDVVTNTLDEPATVNVTVTKKWVDHDNLGDTRPSSLAFTLYAAQAGATEGEAVASVQPTVQKGEGDAADTWTYTWTGLRKFTDAGQLISYYATEDVPAGYVATYSGLAGRAADGDTVTNALEDPLKTSLSITKKWDDWSDLDGVRPGELAFSLYADDELYADAPEPAVAKRGNVWTVTWSDLPRMNDAGDEVAYRVSETVPEGYEASYSGTDGKAANGDTITNRHVPTTPASLAITKKWADSSDAAGARPDTLAFTLYADGEEVADAPAPTIVKAGDTWAIAWANLPRFNDDQEEITYSAAETVPDGYSASYSGAVGRAQNGDTITNTLKPTDPPGKTDTTDPDVSIAKAVDKTTAKVGDQVVYTLTVSNKGTAAAGGVFVKDRVPEGMRYVSATGPGAKYGGTVDGGEFVTWWIPGLSAGESQILKMTVKINECNATSEFRNTALLEVVDSGERPSDSHDPDPAKGGQASNAVKTTVAGDSAASARTGSSMRGKLPTTGDPLASFLLVAAATAAAAAAATAAAALARRRHRETARRR